MGCLVVYLQGIGIACSTFEKGVMILGEQIKRNKRVKFVQGLVFEKIEFVNLSSIVDHLSIF